MLTGILNLCRDCDLEYSNPIFSHDNLTYDDVIITDKFCIALFSGVHKLTTLYNSLQHFLSWKKKKIKGNMFMKVIHIRQLTVTLFIYIYTEKSTCAVWETAIYKENNIILLLPTHNSIPPSPQPCPQHTCHPAISRVPIIPDLWFKKKKLTLTPHLPTHPLTHAWVLTHTHTHTHTLHTQKWIWNG